jgi:hypothetical protein
MTLLLAGCLLGCSTTYEAELRGQPAEASLSDTPIVHCLRSLGFDDRSSELVPSAQAKSPTLVAVWVTTVGNQGWLTQTPHATAFVHHSEDRWRVHFDAGQYESHYFADAFSRCISRHDPKLDVETRAVE